MPFLPRPLQDRKLELQFKKSYKSIWVSRYN